MTRQTSPNRNSKARTPSKKKKRKVVKVNKSERQVSEPNTPNSTHRQKTDLNIYDPNPQRTSSALTLKSDVTLPPIPTSAHTTLSHTSGTPEVVQPDTWNNPTSLPPTSNSSKATVLATVNTKSSLPSTPKYRTTVPENLTILPGTPNSTLRRIPSMPNDSNIVRPDTPSNIKTNLPGTPYNTDRALPGTPNTKRTDPGTPNSAKKSLPGTPNNTKRKLIGTPNNTRSLPGTPGNTKRRLSRSGTPNNTKISQPGTLNDTRKQVPATPNNSEISHTTTPNEAHLQAEVIHNEAMTQPPTTPNKTQTSKSATPNSKREQENANSDCQEPTLVRPVSQLSGFSDLTLEDDQHFWSEFNNRTEEERMRFETWLWATRKRRYVLLGQANRLTSHRRQRLDRLTADCQMLLQDTDVQDDHIDHGREHDLNSIQNLDNDQRTIIKQ